MCISLFLSQNTGYFLILDRIIEANYIRVSYVLQYTVKLISKFNLFDLLMSPYGVCIRAR